MALRLQIRQPGREPGTSDTGWLTCLRRHGRACPTAVRQGFCLRRRTTLILLVSRVSRLTWTRKRINAVRHTNSVFHDLLKLVPWATFDKLVAEFGTDETVRRFTTRASVPGAAVRPVRRRVVAARDRGGDGEPSGRLYHVGAPRRSARPSPTPIATAIRASSPGCSRTCWPRPRAGFRRKMGDAVRLIDSTEPAAGRGRRAMGAFLQRRLRRQGACRSTIPTSAARSITR